MLRHERGLAVVAEKAGRYGYRATGIKYVDHRLAVVRSNFYGRVPSACRCSADEQRQFETLTFHLAGNMDHLVERRRDQTAQADQVYFLYLGALEDFFGRDPHAHVNDFVVVTGEHDADDVLADVVNVTLDRCKQNLSLG